MKIFIALFLAAFVAVAASAQSASRITLTVTATNVAATTNTFTINASTRTWTNAHSATTILTNLTSKNASATNLWSNFSSFPIGSGITHRMTDTNVVVFTAPFGAALSGSSVGNWATTILSTQSGPVTFTAYYPMENIVVASNRTNQGSSLVYGLGIYSTNAFPTNSTAVSNHITKGASPLQNISSPLTIAGAVRAMAQLFATNGFTSSMTNINPVLSNGVNYGTAFRSPGTHPNSEQFGSGASSGGGNSVQIGVSATAGTNGVAIGYFTSSGYFGTVLGGSSDASAGTNGIIIGQNSTIGASSNAVIIGNSGNILDRHHDSVIIGQGATSATNSQIVLGTSAYTVVVPGMLSVSGTITNATLRGTNIINGQIVVTPTSNSGLANGYNDSSVLAMTAAYQRFSGPTAAYTNVGFSAANKMDGKMHFLQFDNPGLSLTILHDSGLDSDTNRVYTGTGALVNSTNNPVHAILSYDTAVNRWRIWSFR